MGEKYPRHKQLVWYMRFDGTIWSLLTIFDVMKRVEIKVQAPFNSERGSSRSTRSRVSLGDHVRVSEPRDSLVDFHTGYEHGELERRHVGHAGRGGEVHVALLLRRRRVREHLFIELVSRGHEF